MKYDDYIKELPDELELAGKVNELKLLKLYAYNYFYNADSLHVDDVNDRCTFQRVNDFGIDGVFIDNNLDENTIVVLYSMWVNEEDDLKLMKIGKVLNDLRDFVISVKGKHYTLANQKAENILTEDLDSFDEDENKNVELRIITNAIPSDKDKNQIKRFVLDGNWSIKGLHVTADIAFGDDVKDAIEANIAPWDYVDKEKLVVDSSTNILRYNDNSFICNVSAKSLKALWKKEGRRGLMAMNLRYYVKQKAIDDKIQESITFKHDNFWYMNNGIIIVCDDYKFNGNDLIMEHFSIVNGGQTTRMIGEIDFDEDFYVACKVVKNIFETQREKNLFVADVAEASNTQKPIKIKDIIANRIEQRELKQKMQDHGIFVEVKRGDKYNKDVYPEPWQKTTSTEIAQDLYSFVYMEPGPARSRFSSILSNEEKYKKIFADHEYNVEFLGDVVYLEKLVREYMKVSAKRTDLTPIKTNLIKNGLCYIMATVGYSLKLMYNSEFANDMRIVRNKPYDYDKKSTELAFVNGFIKHETNYKKYKLISFDLFDYVVDNYIVPTFEAMREVKPDLGYSQWTKTNTGFNLVRKRIEEQLFDRNDQSLMIELAKYFAQITQDQKDKNIDTYVDYVKKAYPQGEEIDNSSEDKEKKLRDDLMIFRMNYSITRHIPERRVMSDVQMEKIIASKPTNKEELTAILGGGAYFIAEDVLKIVKKYC